MSVKYKKSYKNVNNKLKSYIENYPTFDIPIFEACSVLLNFNF